MSPSSYHGAAHNYTMHCVYFCRGSFSDIQQIGLARKKISNNTHIYYDTIHTNMRVLDPNPGLRVNFSLLYFSASAYGMRSNEYLSIVYNLNMSL